MVTFIRELGAICDSSVSTLSKVCSLGGANEGSFAQYPWGLHHLILAREFLVELLEFVLLEHTHSLTHQH